MLVNNSNTKAGSKMQLQATVGSTQEKEGSNNNSQEQLTTAQALDSNRSK
jgi:hypothetical protein